MPISKSQETRISMQNETWELVVSSCQVVYKHKKKLKIKNKVEAKMPKKQEAIKQAGISIRGYANGKKIFHAMTGRRGAMGIALGPVDISRFDMSMSLPSYFWPSFSGLALETRTG
jgi:hypothetical protein